MNMDATGKNGLKSPDAEWRFKNTINSMLLQWELKAQNPTLPGLEPMWRNLRNSERSLDTKDCKGTITATEFEPCTKEAPLLQHSVRKKPDHKELKLKWHILLLVILSTILVSIIACSPIRKVSRLFCNPVMDGPLSPILMAYGAIRWDLCKYQLVTLILNDNQLGNLNSLPIVKCPENVYAVDVFDGIRNLQQSYRILEQLPNLSILTIVGPMDIRNVSDIGERKIKEKLKLPVSTLRLTDVQNCFEVYDYLHKVFEMPCLKKVEFECVLFSKADRLIIPKLARTFPTINGIGCSGSGFCINDMSNLGYQRNLTIQLNFKDCEEY